MTKTWTMGWKEFSKDYITFTRKERIGLLVIIIIIIGIWIFPKVMAPNMPNFVPNSNWIAAMKELEQRSTTAKKDPNFGDESRQSPGYEPLPNQYPVPAKIQLFNFDPNTLPFEGWQKLGIRDRTIGTIQKYISKGGHFYKQDDLKKIYGIHPDEYARLEPYIKIAVSDIRGETFQKKEFTSNAPREIKNLKIDINIADTTAFIALPGIGSKLASRIINFRDKLGGFYATDQVSEIYGLPDSTYQKIRPLLFIGNNEVKKININSVTRDELKMHPYLKWTLANAIISYREQHGNFTSVDDLKKISLISEEQFDKIKFYLSL